jgi:hypothetical protein
VRMHRPQTGCPRVLQETPRLRACDVSALANAPHHLPAEAGEARCSRSGACGC